MHPPHPGTHMCAHVQMHTCAHNTCTCTNMHTHAVNQQGLDTPHPGSQGSVSGNRLLRVFPSWSQDAGGFLCSPTSSVLRGPAQGAAVPCSHSCAWGREANVMSCREVMAALVWPNM